MDRFLRFLAVLAALVIGLVPIVAAEAGDGLTVFYKIVNRASGRLLSAYGGGTSEGTDCIIYDDVGASDQLWIIEDSDLGFKKLINKRSGRALSTTDGGTSNGVIVHLWHYLSTAPDQDWFISPSNTAGYVKIANRKRLTAVLSLVQAGTTNNVRAQTWDDVNAIDQYWQIVPAQTFDPNTLYQIVNNNSRTALSVYQGGTQNNNICDVFEFINQPDQFWKIVSIGGGYYHVVNFKSGRLLSLLQGATGNGVRAMIYDDVGASDQAWSIYPGPEGLYRFSNQRRTSGLLSIVGAQTARESQAQIWDDVAAFDQSWYIIPSGNSIAVNALDVSSANVPRTMTGVGMENVNHEIYGGIYSQLIYGEMFNEPAVDTGVSGMWRAVQDANAAGTLSFTSDSAFQGGQSQRIMYSSGSGRLGVENRGLNRWGISFVQGQSYDGYAYMRTSAAVQVTVSAESGSGTSYASQTLGVSGNGWTKYSFNLTPNQSDTQGRISITITSPATLDIGYMFFQPGSWGRYKDLPVRKDIGDAMAARGVNVLRYGGSSVLVDGYRWKNMIGPREFRPPFRAIWQNRIDSQGFGIFDFLNYAEALGVPGIPTFNINESPQDMADLIDYLTAPTSNAWGAKRAADGHPSPYQVAQIELGNEERVDEGYASKFVALAQAIWSKAPNMILTVGDMTYRDMIANPDHITGADSGLDHLGAYKTILDLAASMNGPLAIDLHFFTDTPEFVAHCVDVVANFDAWIQRYNPSVNYHIGIFELNANEHDVGRALGNAVAIGKLKSMGNRISVVTSANALEPDHQNDDGWSQGLIFFNTSRAWIQPPGYVMQMISEDYLPTALEATTSNPALQVAAFTDGSSLSLHVVNMFDAAQTTPVSLMGYSPSSGTMTVTMIRGSRGDVNDASNPTRITPSSTTSNVGFNGGSFTYTFPGNSFTILRLK